MATIMEELTQDRASQQLIQRVMFRVTSLYGLSEESVSIPLSQTESMDSGQVCLMMDSEIDPSGNIGVIDYERGSLKVKYNAQIVFPGMYKLITERKFDSGLLNPIRATATDECTLTPDLKGWRALGCLEFLPGSLWSGAKGG